MSKKSSPKQSFKPSHIPHGDIIMLSHISLRGCDFRSEYNWISRQEFLTQLEIIVNK